MSYKPAIIAVGESKPSYNSMRFATPEEAQRWGNDLLCRWFGAESVTVEPSEDPVNYACDLETGHTKPVGI